MWVKEGKASSVLDILSGECLNQGRLSGARLSDHVGVEEPVVLPHTKRHLLIAEVADSEICDRWISRRH